MENIKSKVFLSVLFLYSILMLSSSNAIGGTIIIDSYPVSGAYITVDTPTSGDLYGRKSGFGPIDRVYNAGTNVSFRVSNSYNGGSFIKWTEDGEDYYFQPSTACIIDSSTHYFLAHYTIPPPSQPDFIVTSIVLNPASPTTGETFLADVTVQNQGTGSGDAGYLTVWIDQPSSSLCSMYGDWSEYVDVLGAGGSRTITFTLQAGSTGTKTFRAVVDSDCRTAELNNNNNESTLTYTVIPGTNQINFASVPSDRLIQIDGGGATQAPFWVYWTSGSSHTIGVSSPQGSGGTQYVFSSWNDGGTQTHAVAPTSATTYTAYFTTQYRLVTSVNNATWGVVSPSGTNWYNSGTSVTLTATPTPGYTFTGWSGGYTGTQNPVTVTMDGPKDITANFAYCSTPGIPSSPTPSNGATGVSNNPTLSWTSSNANSYDFYFGTSSNPSYVGSTTSASYSLPGLANCTIYFWKIVAKNNCGGSASGPVWSFTTGNCCPVPSSFSYLSPSNEAANQARDMDLDWGDSSGATSYDVYFGTTNPPPFLINKVSSYHDPGTLSYGTTYYWQVVAKNSCGNTEGPIWSFSIIPCPTPGVPSGPSPSSGATGVSVTPTLSWAATSNTDSYDVYFGTSSDPPYVGNTTSTIYPRSGLSYSTLYYWKVVAKNNCGNSTSGAVWSFTTNQQPVVYTINVIKGGTGSGTVTSSPPGIDCGSDCTEVYNQGTVVTLTATPSSGSTFGGWSGACSGTGQCSVTMSTNQTVTATFNLQQYTLTVTKAGVGGGTVTSNPAGIDCGSDCSETYNQGTSVTLTATPNAGSTFTGWSGACSGTGGCIVSMTGDKAVTATFTQQQYILTVTKTGTGSGTISSTPPGITCGLTCSASYNPGTTVILTATPNSSSIFTGWSGACSGTSANTQVTMNNNQTCYAVFDLTPCIYTIAPPSNSFTSIGGYGSVTVSASPSGCSGTWIATSNNDWITIISGSSGAADGIVGYLVNANTGSTTRTGTITIAGKTFEITQSGTDIAFMLSVTKAGTGSGTVISSDGKINCGNDCSETYPAGQQIILTATASAGCTFGGWLGAGCGVGETCTVTVNSNKTITAMFNSASTAKHKAIIITGRNNAQDSLWPMTRDNANLAYRALLFQGYTTENIHFLSHEETIDLNGDGISDVDGIPTKSGLQSALTQWASDAESLILFMIGHGSTGIFRISESETVTSAEIDGWIDTLQQQMTGTIIIIYEACKSGSFVSTLAGSKRIVITSTSPGQPAFFLNEGRVSFSWFFWTQIISGSELYEAYLRGRDGVPMYAEQTALIEANGNGIPNEKEDKNIADTIRIGNWTATAADYPVIGTVSANKVLNGQTKAEFYVEDIVSSSRIEQVWAYIVPPDSGNSTDVPVINLVKVQLTTADDNRYKAEYSRFTAEGTYTVAIYAQDMDGNISEPKRITVTQLGSSSYLSVTPNPVAFGNVYVGVTSDKTATLKNDGNANLVVGSITQPAQPFSKTQDNCSGQTIAPNATCTVIYRFAPTTMGNFSSNSNIPFNDPTENPYIVTLNGTGSAESSLTVSKSGAGVGTVTSSPPGINCGHDCTETYSKVQKVKLTARADANSTFTGWSGGGCSGIKTCTVTVDGAVTVSANFALKTPDISVDETPINFGEVKVGKKATKTLKIMNNGTGDLSITVSGLEDTDFKIQGSSSFKIKPKKNYNLRVLFGPKSLGSKTATLTISSDDSDKPMIDISLNGTGQ